MDLFEAYCLQDLEEFKNLLENGADPNSRTSTGWTILMEIFYGDYLDTMEYLKLLLDHGANVNLQNHYGCTALRLASQWDNYDEVELLLRHGADPDIVNNKGKRAIDCAKTKEIKELLRNAELPGPKRAEK